MLVHLITPPLILLFYYSPAKALEAKQLIVGLKPPGRTTRQLEECGDQGGGGI